MSLYVTSQRRLIHQLNQLIPVSLDVRHVYFSPLRATGDRDTLIRITNEATSVLRGTEVMHYRRLDLGDLVPQLLAPPRLIPQATLYELLPALTEALGIAFTEDDIEDAPVTEGVEEYRVVLKAKPSSYGWVGEGTLTFLDLPPISIPLTDLDLRW